MAHKCFGKLRKLSALEIIDPRYEPVVIRSTASTNTHGARDVADLLSEDWTSRKSNNSAYCSILDYHEAYKVGHLTPTAVAEALLPLVRRDVEDVSKHSVAFLDSKVDLVLEGTKRYRDGRPLSPLDGVPVAVKDEEDVSGYRKCLGSKLDFTRKDDATSYCVQRWLDCGAVLMGKTNMHELGMDTTYYCGGSSGGSAYAVSAGLMPVTMGNDGGGSIRIPSAYCGLYGLKPSAGRVSIRPTLNLAKSTGVAGPIAANMVDLEIAYRIMAQPDQLDQDSKLFVAPGCHGEIKASRKKVLGIVQTWYDRADAPVKSACDQALEYLTTELDYRIIDISIPLLHDGQLAHAMTILAEISSGVPSTGDLTPANKVLISAGSKTPAVDFLQAQKLRNLLMQHMSYLYEKYPGMLVITPTTPNAGWAYNPRDLLYGCSDGNMQIRNMEYAYFANFVGCPAISVPVGYVDPTSGTGKVPVGLMAMGEWCSEDELIAFGYDCEHYVNEQLEGGRMRPETFVDLIQLATGGAR